MTISILGCGWYGKALSKSLIEKGITVKGSATSAEKLAQLSALDIKPYLVQFNAIEESVDPAFFECDVLIISIPPKFRQGEGVEYLYKIQKIIDRIVQFQVDKVIYISTTGVYGDNNNEVDELSDLKPDNEHGSILLAAEKLFRDQKSFKTTIIRFAGLVGPGRNPGRFFAGKTNISNGLAPVNLIHLDDCIAISISVIENNAFGYLINACSPDHPAKKDFYRSASLNAGMEVPEFINELKSWKKVNSVVLPKLLDYEFKVPVWNECIFND